MTAEDKAVAAFASPRIQTTQRFFAGGCSAGMSDAASRKRGRPSGGGASSAAAADGDASDGAGSEGGGGDALVFPLARVRKVIRLDPTAARVTLSTDAAPLAAKAAELFAEALTSAAWGVTTGAGRRTLQRGDVSAAVLADERHDFLVDLLPAEDLPAGEKPPPPAAAAGASSYAAGAAGAAAASGPGRPRRPRGGAAAAPASSDG